MSRKDRVRELINTVKTMNRSRRGRNAILTRGAERAMEALKYEMAAELGLLERIQEVGYENMTTKECGSIGGMMTRRMIHEAQQTMMKKLERQGNLTMYREDDEEEWEYGDELNQSSPVSRTFQMAHQEHESVQH